MNQKYEKIAKTLEYLIHKHFLDPNASLSRENRCTAGSIVITADAQSLVDFFSWLCCSDADWLGEQITWKIITTHFSYSFRGLKVTTRRTRQNNTNKQEEHDKTTTTTTTTTNKQRAKGESDLFENWRWIQHKGAVLLWTQREDFKNPWAASVETHSWTLVMKQSSSTRN